MANIPNNEIWYTSSDGNVVTPYKLDVFGASITSNTYENGVGIITFNGNVTTIGNNAFYVRTSLTSITIPNSVTSIGSNTFNDCSGLTSITIGNSVESIGTQAFQKCTSLTSVTIPNSVTTIGNAAFYNCNSLTSITIPNTVTSIGEGAFRSCSSLTSATIGDSVESIGSFVFYGCSNLTHIICMPQTSPTLGDFSPIPDTTKIFVPRGLLETYKSTWSSYSERIFPITFIRMKKPQTQTIPNNEIRYTSSDGNEVELYASDIFGATFKSHVYENGVGIITFEDDVTTIGEGAFESCTNLASITIPNSVITIEGYSFVGTNLTSITIPDSVTSIGDDAFLDCTSLTSVTIGSSVTSINRSSFIGCTGLTSIVISNDNMVYDSRNNCNAIIETSTNKLISGCKNTIIPDSVTSIGDNAFYRCSGLTSVTMPDSVTSVGNSAFYNCTGLTSVIIGDSVTSIGSGAFERCTGLTSVTIGDSVTSIGDNAFQYCSSITSITIPDSVTNIGSNVFRNCTGLTSVTIGDSVTNIGDKTFEGCNSITSITSLNTTPPTINRDTLPSGNNYIIYVPAESVETYKKAQYWSWKASKIQAIQ